MKECINCLFFENQTGCNLDTEDKRACLHNNNYYYKEKEEKDAEETGKAYRC